MALRFRSAFSTFARLKWACCDYKKIQKLIEQLEKYNDDLEKLLEGQNGKLFE
jgi:hypothetical protein